MDNPHAHRVSRLLLGALAALTLSGQILEAERSVQGPRLGMTLKESRVVAVDAGGAAEAAGIRVRDFILHVGHRPVSHTLTAQVLLRHEQPHEPLTLFLEREGEIVAARLTMEGPTKGDVFERLALAGVGILTLMIGLLVFFKKPRPLTLIFALICFGMGYLVRPPYAPPAAWLQQAQHVLLEALTLLTPALFIHFFLLFPLRHPFLARQRRLIGLLYLPSALLLVLAVAVRASDLDPRQLATHWAPQATESGATLLWVAGIAGAVLLFIRTYRHAHTETSRRRVRVILWGTILGTLPQLILVAVFHLWPAAALPGIRLAALSVVLIPLSFGYAIVRHGLFDATLILRRSLAYSVLGILLVLAYFAAGLGFGSLLPASARTSPMTISFLSLMAVALLFLPAQRGIQSLLAGIIGDVRSDPGDLLHEYGRALRAAPDRSHLVRLITESLSEALGVERAAYFERGPQGSYEAGFLYGLPADAVSRYRFSASLSRQFEQLESPIDWGDLETELPFGYLSPGDETILAACGAEMVIPLRAGAAVEDLVLVGRPLHGESLTSRDRSLAATMADEGSIALAHALLHERAREDRFLQHEMDVARELQERLLPKSLPQIESLEISGFSIPCRGVGGDYYDSFRTPGGELLLAIGDASGKGVPGAILMANLQALVKTEGLRALPPWEIVQRINRRLCEMQTPERYVTFCLARVDPLTGTLAYCNAGHPAPLLARTNGEIEELTHGGLPLGIRCPASYEGGETIMRSGDVVLFHTDGINERRRALSGGEFEEYGCRRLRELLRRGRRWSVGALQRAIFQEVRGFAPTPLDDDTTLLLVKML
jgi:sigma-B regulation protein RsbU (phosphoserine phosphatase)